MLIYPVTSMWVMQTPVVYRCMERKYVENFFKDGEIKLSSFSKFRQLPSEKLRDSMEGNLFIVGYHRPSDLHVSGFQGSGENSYILCGTTHNTEDKIRDLGFSAAIRIFDSTSFGIEIGKQLCGLKKGLEGHCIYNDGPIEFLLSDNTPPEDILREADRRSTPDVDDLSPLTNGKETSQTNSVYFKKRPEYHNEMEYRWAWVTDNRSDENIIVKCPSARAFCMPFYCK